MPECPYCGSDDMERKTTPAVIITKCRVCGYTVIEPVPVPDQQQ